MTTTIAHSPHSLAFTLQIALRKKWSFRLQSQNEKKNFFCCRSVHYRNDAYVSISRFVSHLSQVTVRANKHSIVYSSSICTTFNSASICLPCVVSRSPSLCRQNFIFLPICLSSAWSCTRNENIINYVHFFASSRQSLILVALLLVTRTL